VDRHSSTEGDRSQQDVRLQIKPRLLPRLKITLHAAIRSQNQPVMERWQPRKRRDSKLRWLFILSIGICKG
ncbi:MAG: hypothetical protein ACYCPO_06515, partial [Acidobacteriaceae bacterium]